MNSRSSDETAIVLEERTMTRSLALSLTVLGVGVFVGSIAVFSWLFVVTTGTPPTLSIETPSGSPAEVVGPLGGVLVATLVCVVVHEFVHGIAIRLFGGRPRYGIGVGTGGLPYAYATTDGVAFTRNQFIVIALAPLVLVTFVGVVLLCGVRWFWLVIPLAIHASGSVGDLWMTAVLLRYRETVHVEDLATGFRVHGTHSDRRFDRSVGSTVRRFLTASIGFGAVVVVGTVVAVSILSTTGTVGTLSITLPGTATPLLSVVSQHAGSFSVSANPFAVVSSSAIAGGLYCLWKRDP